MLADLDVALVEVLLRALLLLAAPLRQLQQDVVLNVLEFDGRDPALDDPLAEGVDVHLHQRHGADQQVVAGADQIHVQQQMVADQAVDALVVGDGIPGPELDDYLLGAVPAQSALDIVEQEDVVRVRVELKISL